MEIEKIDHKSKRLIFLEMGGDLFSVFTKILVGVFGHSSAMIAEGLHSLADFVNHLFLLVGIEFGKKPADEKHPFGYGKESFFWALLSALFIFEISGGLAVYQGILKIINRTQITNLNLSFLVLGLAFASQVFLLFKSTKHYQIFADGARTLGGLFYNLKFVKSSMAINLWLGDVAAVAGNLLAGIALYLVLVTGNVVYDGLASIIIGVLLALFGLFLINDAKKLLIGEAVTPATYERIVEIIRSCPEVGGIVKLKTMHLTPQEILINADIDFKPDLDTKEIEEAIDRIEHLIKSQIPTAKQISIEVESRK